MALLTQAERRRVALFQSDHAEGLRAILLAAGCEDPGREPETVCLAFANYRLRRIPVPPRQVHRSDTLVQRVDLSQEERDAIDQIEAKMRAGADLYPHQSTSLRNPLAKDGLLADWQIQHLHLGLTTGRLAVPPFVNRSQRVLLVRITDTDAYLIDCALHGNGVEPPWWNIDLPETIHHNWPLTIAHLKIDGYEPKLTWEQHRQLRPQGRGCTFTTAVTVADGTSYLLSHGMLTSGHSTEAGRYADAIQTRVVQAALVHRDDEKMVLRGDHRIVNVYFEPR
jgi:hypothetical protein